MSIKIYVKTHNITGLKYLGKTKSDDPYSYRGSGKYWKLHIRKHGYDVTTEILVECRTNEEVKKWGTYYSKLWDVVNSDVWANLKIEDGDGGAMTMTEIHRKRISESSKGRVFTEQHRKNLSEAGKGRPDTRSPETKAAAAIKASSSLKGRKKPEGFAEEVSKRMTGSKRDDDAKEKMRIAWTKERRKDQSNRTKTMNLERRGRARGPRNEARMCCMVCRKERTVTNIEKYHLGNCSMLKQNRVRNRSSQKMSLWSVISPAGEQYEVTNMRQFCKEHGLNPGTMTEVALGNRPHHKLWRVLTKR